MATNALIAEALASNKAAPEKLSPDGGGAPYRPRCREKIVAYGKTQGKAEADAKVAGDFTAGSGETRRAKVAAARPGAAEAGRK